MVILLAVVALLGRVNFPCLTEHGDGNLFLFLLIFFMMSFGHIEAAPSDLYALLADLVKINLKIKRK